MSLKNYIDFPWLHFLQNLSLAAEKAMCLYWIEIDICVILNKIKKKEYKESNKRCKSYICLSVRARFR